MSGECTEKTESESDCVAASDCAGSLAAVTGVGSAAGEHNGLSAAVATSSGSVRISSRHMLFTLTSAPTGADCGDAGGEVRGETETAGMESVAAVALVVPTGGAAASLDGAAPPSFCVVHSLSSLSAPVFDVYAVSPPPPSLSDHS